jgi:hypothetical protein
MAKVLKVLKMLKVLNFWGVGKSNIFTFIGAALHPHPLRPLPARPERGTHPYPLPRTTTTPNPPFPLRAGDWLLDVILNRAQSQLVNVADRMPGRRDQDRHAVSSPRSMESRVAEWCITPEEARNR